MHTNMAPLVVTAASAALLQSKFSAECGFKSIILGQPARVELFHVRRYDESRVFIYGRRSYSLLFLELWTLKRFIFAGKETHFKNHYFLAFMYEIYK